MAQKTASTHNSSFVRGTHQFHIAGYGALTRAAARNFPSRSDAFPAGGHTWALACGFDDQGHLPSISLELLTALVAEDVVAMASLKIDDPLRRWPAAVWRSDDANVFSGDNRSWKLPAVPDVFHGQEERYVSDDHLTILCTVDVFEEDSAPAESRNCFVSAVPPPTITGDLRKLIPDEESESDTRRGMRPDVTFVVERTEIRAHRLVLAMRSRVFALEFRHGANSSSAHARVKIDDMSASTFRAVIRFIYTDDLPIERSNVDVARDLLLTADRYDLPRLSLMCENILSESMDVATVMPTLKAVHGRRCCWQLEASCLEYLASNPDVMDAAVEGTKDYKEHKKKKTTFLVEVRKKVDAHKLLANNSPSEIDSCPRTPPPEKSMSTFDLSEVVRATHQFKIPNFGAVQKIHGVGQEITSGTFQVGGYDWNLMVYPSGSFPSPNQKAGKYISVYLQLLSDPGAAHVRASMTFKMDDPSGKLPSRTNYIEYIFTEASAYGCEDYATLKSARSQYLPYDGSLTISCRIAITKEDLTGKTTATNGAATILVPPSNITWHLEHLLLSEMGSDARFLVEKSIIRAHRLVLAARSLMLYESTNKGNHIVRIDNMKTSVFKAVLHFIYTDELPGDCMMMAEEMFAAACQFRLERMKTMCENLLAESISKENALNTLKVARSHHCLELEEYCIEFMALPHVATDLIRTMSMYALIKI